MNLELVIRPEAEVDIAEAFDWYENRVPGLGSEFLLVLDALFNSILISRQAQPQSLDGESLKASNKPIHRARNDRRYALGGTGKDEVLPVGFING